MITLSRTAMILAAGLGKRLGKITLKTPKPLVPIGDTNGLEIGLNILKNYGFKRIIINTHYLADQINAYVKKFKDVEIILSHEKTLLETAGGIRNALHEFNNLPFVVMNADMYWKDSEPSIIHNLQQTMQPTDHFCLGLIPLEKALAHAGKGDFVINDKNLLQKPIQENTPKFVYMGVQIINPSAIMPLKLNQPLSLACLYYQAARENLLRGCVFNGLWVDTGTPEGLETAKTMV